MSMPATTLERVRRYRDRRRSGAAVLPFVTVSDEVGLVELLIAAGLLADHDRDDRTAIARAAGRLLDIAVAQNQETP